MEPNPVVVDLDMPCNGVAGHVGTEENSMFMHSGRQGREKRFRQRVVPEHPGFSNGLADTTFLGVTEYLL